MNTKLMVLIGSTGLLFSSIGFAEMPQDNNLQQPMTQTTPSTSPPTSEQPLAKVNSESQKFFELDLKKSDGKLVSVILTKEDADLLKKGDTLEVDDETLIDNDINN